MLVLEEDDPVLYARILEKNLLRQYDYLANCVEIGISRGPAALDKYTIWAFNLIAVANISQFSGRYRCEPIYVRNHVPPHWRDVPELMDRYISTIHENWYNWTATELAAYALWRLNWIHPFIEGNGRTARATCYYVLCVREGSLLRGDKIVPERIRENPEPYKDALKASDGAWEDGNLDTADMESYLANLVQAQMIGVD